MKTVLNIPLTVEDTTDGANGYPKLDERREVALAILRDGGAQDMLQHIHSHTMTTTAKDGSPRFVSTPVLVVRYEGDLSGVTVHSLCVALRQRYLLVRQADDGVQLCTMHGFCGPLSRDAIEFIE